MNGHYGKNDHLVNARSLEEEVESHVKRENRVDLKDDEDVKLDYILRDLTATQRIPFLLASLKTVRHDDHANSVRGSAEWSKKFNSLNKATIQLRIALDTTDDAKDVFRQADGFESLLATLTIFSQLFSKSLSSSSPDKHHQKQQQLSLSRKEDKGLVDFAINAIATLNEAIRQHQGNKRSTRPSINLCHSPFYKELSPSHKGPN